MCGVGTSDHNKFQIFERRVFKKNVKRIKQTRIIKLTDTSLYDRKRNHDNIKIKV